MKKIILFVFVSLMLSSFASAQTFRSEFAKIRTITLFESTRDDVRKILTGYKSNEDDKKKESDEQPILYETFSSKIAKVEIEYTEGDCADDGVWNLPAGRVKLIEIIPGHDLKFADFGKEFSGLKKEQMYAGDEDQFAYHNKNLGIAFHIDEGEIEKIIILPTVSYYSKLCDDGENDEVENFKKYFTSESYFLEPDLEKRVFGTSCPVPVINEVVLSKVEIILGHTVKEQRQNYEDKVGEISVYTNASDPENDILTYNYTVSAGKIIGKGSKVIWDLKDALPGTYTITATIDDGCGVCAAPMTKTVIVK